MKRKNFFLTVLTTILIFGQLSGVLFSQSPVGKWVDSRYNITLVLNTNFTYSLKYQGRQSSGYWSNRGNIFCLKDKGSTIPICYTIVSYSTSKLVLRDVKGVIINYAKSISTPIMPKRIIRKNKSGKSATIFAKKGNYILTERDFLYGLGLTQFVIGRKVKKSEVKELKNKLIEEFNTNPGEVLRQLKSLGASMQKVHNSTDPAKIGIARQTIFTAFYKATRNMNEYQKPLIIQVINRYIKVLAYDEANNLLLTDKDVDGYINYIVFNSDISGNKINLNYTVKRAVKDQLVKNFNSLPLSQKQLLASASLIWKLVDSNWKKLSYSQRVQYVNAYRAKISNNFKYNQRSTNYNNYKRWVPPKNYGSQKKSLSQMRREFNAKQNMFRMMNNMNMNSHALSLNIIENIGGTGNYWKVSNY